MNPPPPMPHEYGSTTPRTAAAATAASIAFPPWRSVSIAACVARGSTVAAPPPVPTAVGCFGGAEVSRAGAAAGIANSIAAARTARSMRRMADSYPRWAPVTPGPTAGVRAPLLRAGERHHRVQHRVLVERRVEGRRRRGFAPHEPDEGRVARLDLHDRAGGREDVARPDARRRAVVGAHPGVLERPGELQERPLVREHGAEADLRSRNRHAAEPVDRLGDRIDVGDLVVADLAHEPHRLAAHVAALGDGARVERRLDVLEREREVEDVDAAAGLLRARAAHARPDGRAAEQRAGRQGAAGEERAARHAVDLDGRELGDRERCGLGHGDSSPVGRDQDAMNGLTRARTCSMVIALANAPSGIEPSSGAPPLKPWPTSLLSAAAWRASTLWIESAAARISLLLIRPAWPRYAAAPRFSTTAAVRRIFVGPAAMTSSNFVVGIAAGVPPRFFAVASRASTCERSVSAIRFARSATARSLIWPLITACR